ncbi:MAG: hypothetical protein ABIH40_02755 [Candidatus Omnitrophota bacterium]
MINRLAIRVADIPLSIISNSVSIENINFAGAYKKFAFNGKKTEINIRAHYDKPPEISLEDKNLVIGMKGIWRLYDTDKKRIFVIEPVSPERRIAYGIDYVGCKLKFLSRRPIHIASSSRRIAVFDRSFADGDVYVDFLAAVSPPMPDPLEMPLSELLTMAWLSGRQGLLFHGCGVMDKGRGYLFLGFSGHGKSTMADIWRKKSVVLDDDRIVLRKRKGRFWMFAAPWYGRDVGTAKAVLLDKIFFIRHGLRNRAYRGSNSNALLLLLNYSYRPLWDKQGIEQNIGLCAQLAYKLPCYILDFIPDERAVEYVRNLK